MSKSKRKFCWKRKNGNINEIIYKGRAAFAVISDFIMQNPDMYFTALSDKFAPIALRNGEHKRIELSENVPLDQEEEAWNRYFIDDRIKLKSGETVFISSQWGIEKQWKAFIKYMAKPDMGEYSIWEDDTSH